MVAGEVAVISGKGGTGKTTISSAFAYIAKSIVLADCDVDAPDLHILLHPEIEQTTDFIGSKVAVIDENLCTMCGICEAKCRFNAAHPPRIDPIACEGCGVCEFVCPARAIEMVDHKSGHVFRSRTFAGPMVHAKLIPGEGNSGKLVTEVRKLASTIAKENEAPIVLIDGSPGIGCSVIATVTGIRIGVIVTEPTLSGIHDMERVLKLLDQFRVRPMVIINKHDLNPENTEHIEAFCRNKGIEILGKISFDRIMTESMVAAKTLPEYAPDHPLTRLLQDMWARVEEVLAEVRTEH
ncbi:MAG: nucleotide-binding protein [Candidatus Thorarchaeota archaeon]|nr:MAG: (4Fe-4S)-binding protein [Candidatus Thorarchaeota archaeon]RLI59730.1 MAG: (4Fe-4S)-binding protein [Candidatus Thorarchaeota archaeon]